MYVLKRLLASRGFTHFQPVKIYITFEKENITVTQIMDSICRAEIMLVISIEGDFIKLKILRKSSTYYY